MSIIIRIYILLCIALLIFDICFLFVQNQRTLVAYRTNRTFEKKVREEIAAHRESGAFTAEFTDSLSRELSKTKNLLTLQGVIENDAEAREWFRPYVFAQLEQYAAKDDPEQAYYTYVLSTFDYSREKPPVEFLNALLGFLDSKSLYTFSNTMTCLYAIVQTAPLMCAMDKVNERKDFYHKKLLVDGLLSAQTEDGELDARLEERFDSYTPYMQDCLLDYFRLRGSDVSGLCMRVLRSERSNSQVGYSAMRYFAKHPSKESRTYFLEILADDSAAWIQQMLSIQALRQYDDPAVYAAVMKKITSPNWYVRVNAVEYLHNRGLTKEEIFNILYQRDRYANESLLYQYRGNKEMTRYIIDTIQLLNMQDETVGVGGDLDTLCDAASAAVV